MGQPWAGRLLCAPLCPTRPRPERGLRSPIRQLCQSSAGTAMDRLFDVAHLHGVWRRVRLGRDTCRRRGRWCDERRLALGHPRGGHVPPRGGCPMRMPARAHWRHRPFSERSREPQLGVALKFGDTLRPQALRALGCMKDGGVSGVGTRQGVGFPPLAERHGAPVLDMGPLV